MSSPKLTPRRKPPSPSQLAERMEAERVMRALSDKRTNSEANKRLQEYNAWIANKAAAISPTRDSKQKRESAERKSQLASLHANVLQEDLEMHGHPLFKSTVDAILKWQEEERLKAKRHQELIKKQQEAKERRLQGVKERRQKEKNDNLLKLCEPQIPEFLSKPPFKWCAKSYSCVRKNHELVRNIDDNTDCPICSEPVLEPSSYTEHPEFDGFLIMLGNKVQLWMHMACAYEYLQNAQKTKSTQYHCTEVTSNNTFNEVYVYNHKHKPKSPEKPVMSPLRLFRSPRNPEVSPEKPEMSPSPAIKEASSSKSKSMKQPTIKELATTKFKSVFRRRTSKVAPVQDGGKKKKKATKYPK